MAQNTALFSSHYSEAGQDCWVKTPVHRSVEEAEEEQCHTVSFYYASNHRLRGEKKQKCLLVWLDLSLALVALLY